LIRKTPGRQELQDDAMQATGALIQLKQTGPLDALANSKLAWLAQAQGQREIAENLARETLAMEKRPTLAWIDATSLLAQIAFQKGDKQQAAQLYRKLVQHDRDSYELYYLGLCENNVGNTEAAISALKKSIELDPLQVSAHLALRAIYHATGQPAKSAIHEQAAKRNQTLLEKLRQPRAEKN
jgi:tetratricopeptide (TPR) repeat protein